MINVLTVCIERVMHGVSSNSPLPPSVAPAYYRKCIELKRRINEIEENNDSFRVKKLRIERAILKMRMERALLLEQIADRMKNNPEDSDDSNSPPATVRTRNSSIPVALCQQSLPQPQEKPLRSKRGHRKMTPPPAAANVPTTPPPAGTTQMMLAASQSQSTPEPRFLNEYIGSINGVPLAQPIPLQLSNLPATLPSPPGAAQRSYVPAHDERIRNGEATHVPAPAFATINQPAHRPSEQVNPPEQNGQASGDRDTEMGEADSGGAGGLGGFTAVNR